MRPRPTKPTRHRAADTGRTNIVIRATRKIMRGTEIRMDYDLGDAERPYHAQLIAAGATEEALADVRYRTMRWRPPGALIQQRAEARARRAGHMMEGVGAGTDTTIPGGRKRANTTSRWEGGDGAPEIGPGEARRDGEQARHDGGGE